MIHYVTGDATNTGPTQTFFGLRGPVIIAHVCNDIGAWGAGFVLAVSKAYPGAEEAYLEMTERELGQVQFVTAGMAVPFQERPVIIANMIGQRGVRGKNNEKPIRYEAVRECLQKVATRAKSLHASVHMPRIGCGLAGGNWDEIEAIIKDELADVEVFVYTLERELALYEVKESSEDQLLRETTELAMKIEAGKGEKGDAMLLAHKVLFLHGYMMHGMALPTQWMRHRK